MLWCVSNATVATMPLCYSTGHQAYPGVCWRLAPARCHSGLEDLLLAAPSDKVDALLDAARQLLLHSLHRKPNCQTLFVGDEYHL